MIRKEIKPIGFSTATLSTRKAGVEKGSEIYRKSQCLRTGFYKRQKLFISLRVIPKQAPEESKLQRAQRVMGSPYPLLTFHRSVFLWMFFSGK